MRAALLSFTILALATGTVADTRSGTEVLDRIRGGLDVRGWDCPPQDSWIRVGFRKYDANLCGRTSTGTEEIRRYLDESILAKEETPWEPNGRFVEKKWLTGSGLVVVKIQAKKKESRILVWSLPPIRAQWGFFRAGQKAYEQGDPALALQYWRKASAGGHYLAVYAIGGLYYEGAGVERDLGEAFEKILLAAQLGVPTAQSHVAYMYAAGEGTEADPSEAFFWYSVAAEDDDQAQSAAERLAERLDPDRVAAMRERVDGWEVRVLTTDGRIADEPPVLIAESRVRPIYPELARVARMEGSIVLGAVIGADGGVRDAEILELNISGLGFEESSIDAVEQWRFEPAKLDGEPVEVFFRVVVDFDLQ